MKTTINFQTEQLSQILSERFNCSGKCLAAESYFSKKNNVVQFGPLCLNKWKSGCSLKGNPGACQSCPQKQLTVVNEVIYRRHIYGKNRFGIYPALPEQMTQFIVIDVDGHNEWQNPVADAKSIDRMAADFQIPIMIFTSNSGKGYHIYLFFKEPVSYAKARGVVDFLLDRAGNLSSVDCIKPARSCDFDTVSGGLIALPFNKQAYSERKSTVPVDNNLNPVADTFEACIDFFEAEYSPITPEQLDDFIREYQIDIAERVTSILSDPSALKRMGGEIAPCIQYILTQKPKTERTNFNKLVHNIVKFLQGIGMSFDQGLVICSEFISSYAFSQTYTTPEARKSHFITIWKYLSRRPDQPFDCRYILGLKLPGSAFECRQCPLREPEGCFNENDEWDEPIPLSCDLLPVMTFNPEWLPSLIRKFVEDIAYRQQSPIDYVAIGAIVSIGAVVGKRIAIQPKRNDNAWICVPNLFGCIIGRPSAKKTPALQEVLKPLYRLEATAKKTFYKENKQWEINSKIKEMQKPQIKKEALKSVKSGDKSTAINILTQFEDANPKPTRKRFIVNDTTIEKLGELLAENPNGVLLCRDELFGFLKTINREDRSNDRAFYLESWSGTGSYTYDRIGRGTIDVENCIVSLLGCLTPSKIFPLVQMSLTGGIEDDGFIQRFQLMVYPDDTPFKYVDEKPDANAFENALKLFGWLEGLEISKNDKYQKIPTLKFSNEAHALFVEWLENLEREISSPDIHQAIESHLAKYRSLIPILALIFHLSENMGNLKSSLKCVDVTSLQKAIQFGNYLKSHAFRIYGIAINNDSHLAKMLLNKIKAKKLGNPFVIRDVKRAQWHGFAEEGSVEKALSVLIENGYLKKTITATSGKNRVLYHVNPKIFSE